MNTKTLLLALAIAGVSCHKTTYNNPGNPGDPGAPTGPIAAPGLYTQIDLVESVPGSYASFTDTTLVNPWGIAVNPSAHLIWTASNHTAKTQAYDSTGTVVWDAGQKLKTNVLNVVGAGPWSFAELHGGSSVAPTFIPAATYDWLLPLYDPISKLLGSEAALSLYEKFTPLISPRAFGALEQAKLKEIGLDAPKRKLTVTVRGVAREFDRSRRYQGWSPKVSL